MDKKDLLLSMYEEQAAQARQHEELRAKATNLTFIAGSVLISLLFKDGKPIVDQTALAGVLIGVGIFGVLLSLKHYERNRLHVAIARRYRQALEHELSTRDLSLMRELGQQDNERKYPWLSRLRLNWLWSSSCVVFIIVGVTHLMMSWDFLRQW
ncbi:MULTISPECIES: hypothetical protein [unclassified Sinorhizobium]|uniref:hypothetical protein n=1 Tax=unclassified Sinorhizobium TaxID=2613772 RepID=UPI0024C2E704|nr:MULTISPECIES: hypothetical protein [unclassified Sinorhizobium]MDK1377242.1 hypothetical protein [Sinorhizobium sp. 6-70]MDK1478792.1 hypothetical protein [Sinorhizobium sp. 6-117]